jgi:hypothetical protein
MLLNKEQLYRAEKRWINLYEKVLNIYNNKKHRRLPNLSPNEVGTEHFNLLRQTSYKRCRAPVSNSKIKVGNRVRISMYRNMFSKNSEAQNWSARIYTVKSIKGTCPLSYTLEDENGETVLGSFTQKELLVTKYPQDYLIEKVLKRKNGKLYVKFFGMNSHGWVDEIK